MEINGIKNSYIGCQIDKKVRYLCVHNSFKRIIGFTCKATVLLQKTEMDLAGVKSKINTLPEKCSAYRSNIDIVTW